MAAVFLMPLLRVLWQSVTTIEGAFTFAGYGELLSSRLFVRVLGTSLEISAMATAFTLIIAYPIAYHLSRQEPRRRALFLILVMLPFWTSILVKSFAFTVILGQNGIVNRILMELLGWESGVKLLYNRIGVIIGLAHNFIPFVVFPILASLLAQNPALGRAAAVMGAGPARIFLRVTLPLSLPGVVAGCFLTFILSLGFFITPALLGGRGDVMLANLVDFYTRETLNWTLASAMSVVLLALSAVLLLLLSRSPGGRVLFGQTVG
jgi:ABC-type spermidine/putrescine transport system permease subunit I